MIYITQLIFVKEGQEEKFLEFERQAIPLMERYNGRILYRIRPGTESIIEAHRMHPYEIHVVSFNSESDLSAFMKDDRRQRFIHLKNESVKSILMIKGEKV